LAIPLTGGFLGFPASFVLDVVLKTKNVAQAAPSPQFWQGWFILMEK
jgi:hypothetical protein